MIHQSGQKVVVVGTGAVGISYAFALLNQGLCNQLVLIDLDEHRASAEARDLRHGVSHAPTPMHVKQGTYADCQGADIVCICAGAPQKPGETRLQLIDNNLNILHGIISRVMASGFDGILLLAANPVDVLSYAAWRFSGLPKQRIIGSGTVLDSARLCNCLSNEFNVAPQSISAYMIGEHGDSVLAAWHAATLAGTSVKAHFDRLPDGRQRMDDIAASVRNAAYSIIEGKGATYYGIAMGLARITRAVLHDQNIVLAVSALFEGEYGHHNVFAGTPAVINRQGISRIVELELDQDEQQKLAASVAVLQQYQQKADAFPAAV